MNEDLKRKKIERGNKAQNLLKNDLLIEYWEKTEKALIDAWTASQDQLERDDLWRNIRILKNMKNFMGKAVIDGRDANKEIGNLTNTRNPNKLQQLLKVI